MDFGNCGLLLSTQEYFNTIRDYHCHGVSLLRQCMVKIRCSAIILIYLSIFISYWFVMKSVKSASYGKPIPQLPCMMHLSIMVSVLFRLPAQYARHSALCPAAIRASSPGYCCAIRRVFLYLYYTYNSRLQPDIIPRQQYSVFHFELCRFAVLSEKMFVV